MAENESRPEGLPPSQGGKYVGFGSSPGPAPRSNQGGGGGGGDVFSVMSEGFRRLSLVVASAANVVQTGTMEFTSKVKEGGLDQTVSETVNVVANKTTYIGQRTWGVMKGVMAIASQKVEEFTKEEASTWNQQNINEGNSYYQNKASTKRKQHQRCRLLMMMMVGLVGMIMMVKMMMMAIIIMLQEIRNL